MDLDVLDLYERGSAWSASKVAGASDAMDAPTQCDGWDVRTLMNHMLDTQRYFVGVARGEDASPPSSPPPDRLGADPVEDFEQARHEIIGAFSASGVIDRTGLSLGTAFSDQLIHGWDLANATGQDSTMPEGLAEAAYQIIHGRFTDEQRVGIFKPEVQTGPDPSAQDKFLAYTGRDPS
ncbi:MAG: TIGR03086 family metal-binding protein [Actinomycetota bacterium]|nr:TIGR03086 family metal-binding protein [Actinomycetota bacterium]